MRLVLFNIFKFSALGMPNIEKLIIIFLLRLKVKKNKIHKKTDIVLVWKLPVHFSLSLQTFPSTLNHNTGKISTCEKSTCKFPLFL